MKKNGQDTGRVVTANLPELLVTRMDEAAARLERSKSWIVREAVTEWLAEERRRHEMTLEAMRDVEEGRAIPHEEVLALVKELKHDRRARSSLSGPAQR